MAKNNKAIITYYNGYKFRSRNEARWAVFFDELQIPYVFEPEGFDLGGVWYLPDFHLTKGLTLHQFEPTQLSEIWVEVKSNLDLSDDERNKIAAFVRRTDHHILLIGGQPDINTDLLFIDHHPETGWFRMEVRWLELPGGEIGLVPVDLVNNSQLLAQTNTPRLRYALDKARQFDHEPKNKDCISCGQPFKPLHPNHVYCHDCYKKQQVAKQPEPVTSPAEQSGTPTTMLRSATQTIADKLVPAAPSPKRRTKRPSFLADKPKKSPTLKKRFLMGCLLPIFVFACAIGVSIWFVAYMMGGGLFGSPPTAVPQATATMAATATVTETPVTRTPEAGMGEQEPTAVCNCTANTYDCSDFSTQAEAQTCFDFCFESVGDIHFLDSNGDKLACETLP